MKNKKKTKKTRKNEKSKHLNKIEKKLTQKLLKVYSNVLLFVIVNDCSSTVKIIRNNGFPKISHQNFIRRSQYFIVTRFKNRSTEMSAVFD